MEQKRKNEIKIGMNAKVYDFLKRKCGEFLLDRFKLIRDTSFLFDHCKIKITNDLIIISLFLGGKFEENQKFLRIFDSKKNDKKFCLCLILIMFPCGVW